MNKLKKELISNLDYEPKIKTTELVKALRLIAKQLATFPKDELDPNLKEKYNNIKREYTQLKERVKQQRKREKSKSVVEEIKKELETKISFAEKQKIKMQGLIDNLINSNKTLNQFEQNKLQHFKDAVVERDRRIEQFGVNFFHFINTIQKRKCD